MLFRSNAGERFPKYSIGGGASSFNGTGRGRQSRGASGSTCCHAHATEDERYNAPGFAAGGVQACQPVTGDALELEAIGPSGGKVAGDFVSSTKAP